jgi:hypothetical protein
MKQILNMINRNPTMFALILYCLAFIVVILNKPQFLFKNNGSTRLFGIGYRNKTILPLWLFSIILGIFSYMVTLYIINFL